MNWRRSWPFAVYGLLGLYFCAPLFANPNGLGLNDWDQHLFYYGSVLKSVLEYRQLPFWNPWYCGGNVLWQNPQVPLLSPAFPLTAVFSLSLAMKINIVLHYWIGLIGMHLLVTSVLEIAFAPIAIYLAVLGTLSGAVAMHLAAGHSVFLPCLYLPLQLFFCLRAMRSGAVRDVVGAAALLALMIYNGALHVVPMSVGAIGLLGLLAAIGQRAWRPLVAAVAIVAAGFAYAAPKVWPVTLWVTSDRFFDARTVLVRPDAMSLEMLLHTYLDRFQYRNLRFYLQRSGWYEYGNYIGAFAAILIAAALAWALVVPRTRDRWLGAALALTSVLLLVLSAGEFSAWAPASLATHLPFFSEFRIPSRYTIVFLLFAVTTLAWAVRAAGLDAPASRGAAAFITLVCVFGTIDLVTRNREEFIGIFSVAPAEHGFRWGGGPTRVETDATSSPYTHDSPMFRALVRDRPFFDCYESLQTKRSATAAPALVAGEGDVEVVSSSFSPNRIDFAIVGGRGPARVLLNENFAPGWQSTAGPVVPSPERGQPMVNLQAGQTGKFSFTFRPPGLIAGLAVLLAAVVVTALLWKRHLPA